MQNNDSYYRWGGLLGGFSCSILSCDKTENSVGSYDYWIIKIDSLGNIVWQNDIGGDSYDDMHQIDKTIDGGYILGGYSNSDISGDKTENGVGFWSDYWIIKVDSLGNIQWQNTIGGNQNDALFSIHQTIDGGYIMGGISSSNISGDKSENIIGGNMNTWDYWIVITNSIGVVQWDKTIGAMTLII